MARAGQLERVIRADPWFVRVLETVRAALLPDAWVGAGVLRDLVWGSASGGFDPGDLCTIRPRRLARLDLASELASYQRRRGRSATAREEANVALAGRVRRC
jgi:uncharacterized protein